MRGVLRARAWTARGGADRLRALARTALCATDCQRKVGQPEYCDDERRDAVLRPTRDGTEWDDRKHDTGQGEIESPVSQSPLEALKNANRSRMKCSPFMH